jgi:cytochrome P450
MAADEARCPFHAALPEDGTPLHPSATLARWREQSAATPLEYDDGHRGLIATRYDLVRAVLEDPRFSMAPARMPLSAPTAEHEHAGLDERRRPYPSATASDLELDERGRRAFRANLLGLSGADHARLRRAVTSRFSFKQARSRQPDIVATVERQLELFRGEGSPNEVWHRYAQPIAAITHCQVLGIPMEMYDGFVATFVDLAPLQQQFDFVREVLDHRRANPGDDVATDLLASDAMTAEEAEGLLHMLMSSGRDSVAYLITTALVALLTHPEQLERLRADPDKIDNAVEEFMRVGAMFVTLFARTATEDIDVGDAVIPAGTSVSPSSVAANRDPDHWERAEEFDIERDAFGHLGFGHGIHGCIGQQLARMEIKEAVSRMIREFPDLRLVAAEQLRPLPFAHPVATYEAGELFVAWE